MKVEIYIGTAWSGGTTGEWYTVYVEVPDDIIDVEPELMRHISAWLDEEKIECAFWGVYNIPQDEDEDDN